jgi:WbqC-like protein family
MKRSAIVQSCYIPWKGYFDLIGSVDEFILYDDAAYSKNGWRNRNRIKTRNGLLWLTIPVRVSGRFGQPIRSVEIADRRWAARHWKTLETSYAQAPHFRDLAPVFRELYVRAAEERFLSSVNRLFIEAICGLLELRTRTTTSMDYVLEGDRTGRLVSLCRQAGAAEYLSGPSARTYLDESQFQRASIGVRWMDYTGYPEYPQLFTPPFVHEVSVLDLLLNVGSRDARNLMRSARRAEAAVPPGS